MAESELLKNDEPAVEDVLGDPLDYLRQEYVRQEENPPDELPTPRQRIQIYLSRQERLKVMLGLVVVAVGLLSVLVFASGAWTRYASNLDSEPILAEVPPEVELEVTFRDPPAEPAFELPEPLSYELPPPEIYTIPIPTPWPTPPSVGP